MSHCNHVGNTFDELEIGQTASLERVCTDNDLIVFAHASAVPAAC